MQSGKLPLPLPLPLGKQMDSGLRVTLAVGDVRASGVATNV